MERNPCFITVCHPARIQVNVILLGEDRWTNCFLYNNAKSSGRDKHCQNSFCGPSGICQLCLFGYFWQLCPQKLFFPNSHLLVFLNIFTWHILWSFRKISIYRLSRHSSRKSEIRYLSTLDSNWFQNHVLVTDWRCHCRLLSRTSFIKFVKIKRQ